MSESYDRLGQPKVTFDTFWAVYCGLRDEVEAATPREVATGLAQSIFDENATEDPFTLAHLKAPGVGVGKVVDVEDQEVGNDDIFTCEFTVEDDRDQLC